MAGAEEIIDLTHDSDDDEPILLRTALSPQNPRFARTPRKSPYGPPNNSIATSATSSNTHAINYVPVFNATPDGGAQSEKRRKIVVEPHPESHMDHSSPVLVDRFMVRALNHRESLAPRHTSKEEEEKEEEGEEDGDSVISDIRLPKVATPGHVINVTENVKLPNSARAQSNATPPVREKKYTAMFSQAENDLLIFLKEVKRLSWSDITKAFARHFPGRSYSKLQNTYSHKLNKRDRSKDPPRLELPPCYASEAVIDWTALHTDYQERADGLKREARDLSNPLKAHRHTFLNRSLRHESYQDCSSGAESHIRHERPRRAVHQQPKNYTWPKRYTPTTEIYTENEVYDSEEHMDAQQESESATEGFIPLSGTAIVVDNQPVLVDFEQQDSELAITAYNMHRDSQGQHLPYLSYKTRLLLQHTPPEWVWDQLCSREWQGSTVHVDFSPEEISTVERVIMSVLKPQRGPKAHSQQIHLQELLSGLSEPKLLQVAYKIYHKVRSRDQDDINAFLQDAQTGQIRASNAQIERLAAARPNRDFSSVVKSSISSMVRRRELNIQTNRGWRSTTQPLSYPIKNKLQDSLGPSSCYTGASSDVHTVVWSTDGQCFAAGAICVDDPHSMQYNRHNNLLYGDVHRNTIHELGEHYVARPKTDSGPNSTHAMYATQDPKLYKTVSSVVFSPNGRYMFSGGYDRRVWMWETRSDGSQPEAIVAMKHKAEVDMMAMNCIGVLATATRKESTNAVKVIKFAEDDPTAPSLESFSSEKATARPDQKILPTALQFSPRYENLLLAGFGANVQQDRFDTVGDICLWDINGHKQLSIHGSGRNVFDVSFHPRQRYFAVGCVAAGNVNRGTKSVVRLYDEKGFDERYSMHMELECKAMDINDVAWCPGNDSMIAAGCTDGSAYVWDLRWPNDVLRQVAHGRSLMPLDEDSNYELTDTGIRFLAWGENATRLYTGSSDGVVKTWNVAHSKEDTFVKDLITVNSGIMSGAFSPDKSQLLIGEVNGSINILEVGKDDCEVRDMDKMKYIPYTGHDDDGVYEYATLPTKETESSGIASASQLIETGQMMHIQMGGLPIRQSVQGPHYMGPFDESVDAPHLREAALKFQLDLSQEIGDQCVIPHCQDSILKVTSEEIGDSGRSLGRIPDEIRQQWKTDGTKLALMPGKIRCSNCGRAALPSSASNNGEVLCERCSFACFRCGAPNAIPPSNEKFTCNACKRIWDIGALGYECLAESTSRADFSDVPSLRGYDKTLAREKKLEEERIADTPSFGDEVNALTDYYFSISSD